MALYLNDSLRYYKADGYLEINQALRRNLSLDTIEPEIREHIINIDKKMALPKQTLHLYRGYSNLRQLLDMSENPVLIEKGYSSCTTSLATTFGFVKDENEFSKCCIIEFILTPENGIKVYEFKDENREKEVLLERGIQYTVAHQQDKKVNGKFYTIFTVLVSKYTPPKIPQEVVKQTRQLIEAAVASSSSASNLEMIVQEAKDLLDLQFMDELSSGDYSAISRATLDNIIVEAAKTHGHSLTPEEAIEVRKEVIEMIRTDYGGEPTFSGRLYRSRY